MFQHRSSQKSTNKPFKGKSKGRAKRLTKGKVEEKQRASVRQVAKGGRLSRVNRGKQIMLTKRSAILTAKTLGTDKGISKIVGLIPLSPNVDLLAAANLVSNGCESDAALPTTNPRFSMLRTNLTRPKQRLQVYACPRDVHAVMDIAKVADILVFIVQPNEAGTEVSADPLSWQLATVVKSQGVPSILGLYQGIVNVPKKKRTGVVKVINRFFQSSLEMTRKAIPIDTEKDGAMALRIMSTIKLSDISWRKQRAYMMAQSVHHQANPDGKTASVRIGGTLRGEGTLAANNLVHITGFDDYQMEQLDCVIRGHPKSRHRTDQDTDMGADENGTRVQVHSRPDQNQESMQSLMELDEMNREQSIITDEEIRMAEREAELDAKRQIPGALTQYQGIWDEIGNDGDDEEEDAFKDIDVEDDSMKTDSKAISQSDSLSAAHQLGRGLGGESSSMDTKQSKLKLERLERDEVDFPDEVETPQDQAARIRFQKYRGMKSFAHGEWDPKENLPLEYGYLTEFEEFDLAKKRVLLQSKMQANALDAGTHVVVQIKNVPLEAAQKMCTQEAPVLLWALYQHERQVSVLHSRLRRHSDDADVLKAKSPMEVHIGFRRIVTKPIYSHDHGKSKRALSERFFHQGRWTIASWYGRIMFPPAQVLLFRTGSLAPGDFPTMVASGSLLSVDPDKLIIKRIVLSGTPVGVHKRMAVCRYMFWNPDDIRWFKPVELRTKYGLAGHIREARGTKGFMKCIFDGFIKPHDTICMHLYKRQYPKWDASEFS